MNTLATQSSTIPTPTPRDSVYVSNKYKGSRPSINSLKESSISQASKTTHKDSYLSKLNELLKKGKEQYSTKTAIKKKKVPVGKSIKLEDKVVENIKGQDKSRSKKLTAKASENAKTQKTLPTKSKFSKAYRSAGNLDFNASTVSLDQEKENEADINSGGASDSPSRKQTEPSSQWINGEMSSQQMSPPSFKPKRKQALYQPMFHKNEHQKKDRTSLGVPKLDSKNDQQWQMTQYLNRRQSVDPDKLRKSFGSSRNNSLNFRNNSQDVGASLNVQKGHEQAVEMANNDSRIKAKRNSNAQYFMTSDNGSQNLFQDQPQAQQLSRKEIHQLQQNIQHLTFRGKSMSVNQLGYNPNGNKNHQTAADTLNIFGAQPDQNKLNANEVKAMQIQFKDLVFRGKEMKVTQLGLNPNHNKEIYKGPPRTRPTSSKIEPLTYRHNNLQVERTLPANSHMKIFNISQISL